MGTVTHLRTEIRFDRWRRVIITEGQRWVEKMHPLSVWIVDYVETLQIDDVETQIIHLKTFDGEECESIYTERYFRKWFYEVNQPQRRRNITESSQLAIPSLKRLLATGPVVSKKK